VGCTTDSKEVPEKRIRTITNTLFTTASNKKFLFNQDSIL
jgi:hypothetical protein